MICYAFALPHEAEDLINLLQESDTFFIQDIYCAVGRLKKRQVLIACVGMGGERAAANMRIVFEFFRLKAVVMSGYGGALVPQLKKGQVVISQNFSSEELASFVRLLPGFQFCNFCCTDEIVASPQRKAEYAAETQCQVIDMETAEVAEFVVSKERPFLAVRVISDESNEVLPRQALEAAFDPDANKPQPIRLLMHLLTNRRDIKPMTSFVMGLAPARKSLTQFLCVLNDELPGNW